MPEPYTAVGLIPSVRGIRTRADIQRNLDHIAELFKAASWLSSLDLPVRLVAIPEGGLQAFNDEVLDLDHVTFARECAIDIPGPETDFLGDLARRYDTFVMAQAKARHEAFPDRFFNVGFAIDPSGEIVLKHHKLTTLYPVEHSMTPHDVFDQWVEMYGLTLDAFFPVADTEIGRLGVLMANEGSYPENARGLAMNGAEVVYRASYPHPHTGNEFFEIQSRARALDNNFYVVAPEPRDLLPARRVRGRDRHVRRALDGHRLQGPRRRAAPLRGRVVLCGRDDRHRRPAALPHPRAVGQLGQGPPHGALPARLRRPDLPEEPLRRSGRRSTTPSSASR